MTSSPSIEFVVPYHGHPGWLQETVRSVLDQTDRGLADAWCSTAILHDLGVTVGDDQGDPRITYVRNETNLGVNANFQRCLDLATGEYVVVLRCRRPYAPRLHRADRHALSENSARR